MLLLVCPRLFVEYTYTAGDETSTGETDGLKQPIVWFPRGQNAPHAVDNGFLDQSGNAAERNIQKRALTHHGIPAPASEEGH